MERQLTPLEMRVKIRRRSRGETLSLVEGADRPPPAMTDSLAGVEGGELVPVVAVLVANESTSDVEASLIALHGQSYGALRVPSLLTHRWSPKSKR